MSETLDRDTLKALSTDTRQDIIKLLSKRPHNPSELSKLLNKHVTTITEHLEVLERANLINRRESTNKWAYYTLTDKGEKIFKPAYYSWVITLSLFFVIVVLGAYQISAQSYSIDIKDPVAASGSDTIAVALSSPFKQTEEFSIRVSNPIERNDKKYVDLEIIQDKGSSRVVAVDQKTTIENEREVISLEVPAEGDHFIDVKVFEPTKSDQNNIVPLEIHSVSGTSSAASTGSVQKSATAEISERTATANQTIFIHISGPQGNSKTVPLTIGNK